MATTLQVSTTPEGVVRVAIEGDLDSATTRDLRDELQALLTRKPRSLEVDLSQLHTIDSSGVGMLVSLYKGMRSQGGQLTITGVRDQPLAIFRLLKLDRALLGN
jgi:anti-sigma B factor antagonist